jgi:antitoxin CcdA
MPRSAREKQRTNITVDAGLLSEARALNLNVSSISEAALARAVRIEQARAWTEENAEAIEARRIWSAGNALPLSEYQVLKTD